MTDREPQKWTGLSLEARHVPEEHDPTKPYPHDTNDPVTGFVDIGTVIDGAFVVIHRRKAPGLFADIERAQANRQQQQQDDQQDDQQQPAPDQQQQSRPPFFGR